jgi:hypothetical protein
MREGLDEGVSYEITEINIPPLLNLLPPGEGKSVLKEFIIIYHPAQTTV